MTVQPKASRPAKPGKRASRWVAAWCNGDESGMNLQEYQPAKIGGGTLRHEMPAWPCDTREPEAGTWDGIE